MFWAASWIQISPTQFYHYLTKFYLKEKIKSRLPTFYITKADVLTEVESAQFPLRCEDYYDLDDWQSILSSVDFTDK